MKLIKGQREIAQARCVFIVFTNEFKGARVTR